MKLKVQIFLFLIILVLCGCQKKEVLKEYTVYEGNLDKIRLDIENYNKVVDVPQIETKKYVRPIKYVADLKLDVEKKVLSGKMSVEILNETETAIDEICIRNYAASILKEKESTSISCVINENTKVEYNTIVKTDPSVIYVPLDNALKSGEKINLTITFDTKVPNKKDRFGYYKEEDKYSFLLTYCFPTIAMYQSGEWTEYPYISHAESNFHMPSDYEVQIETPKGYTVVATGEETVIGNKTIIEAKSIRDLAIVVSNHMTFNTVNADDVAINLYAWDYENTKEYNELSLLAGKDAVHLYTELIGTYAYEELDIVHCFYDSAMEYSGLVLIGYPDISKPEDIEEHASYSTVCSKIVHEVAHQWFYGAVGNNCYVEPWLDEGFAEYCEDMIYSLSGCESVKKAVESDRKRLQSTSVWGCKTEEEWDKWMEIVLEQTKLEVGINQSYETYQKMPENSYSEYVYTSGSNFLYELRKTMGNGAFFKMLQAYYEMAYMKEVTTEEFIQIVRSFDNSAEVETVIQKYID